MARARNLKPGFFRNADLAEFDPWARLLFAGLWLLADREGRLEDKPKQIKIELFPCDALDVDATLQDLADRAPHMLRRYQVNGVRFLQVVNFRKHQNPHKDEKPSTIPDPAGNLPPPPTPKKPGAGTVQAPEQNGSTVDAPGLHGADTVPVGLNPESCILNPESLNLNPSTHKPDPPGGGGGDLSTNGVDKSIVAVLEREGIADAAGYAPGIRQLVEAGADAAAFEHAAKTAVSREKPFMAYVLGVVGNRIQLPPDLRKGAPEPAASPPERAADVPGGVGQGAPPKLATPPPKGFFETARRRMGLRPGGQGGGAVPGAA